jgi:hypothetical protein
MTAKWLARFPLNEDRTNNPKHSHLHRMPPIMKFVNLVLLFAAMAMAAPNPAPNGELLVSLLLPANPPCGLGYKCELFG